MAPIFSVAGFLLDWHIFLLEKGFIRIQLCSRCRFDETRFWKKKGIEIFEKDQLLEQSHETDLLLTSIIFMICQLQWSVFKNACEMRFLEKLLWFGTETAAHERFPWKRNSNCSWHWWYWSTSWGTYCIVCTSSVSLLCPHRWVPITSRSWIGPCKRYYCL